MRLSSGRQTEGSVLERGPSSADGDRPPTGSRLGWPGKALSGDELGNGLRHLDLPVHHIDPIAAQCCQLAEAQAAPRGQEHHRLA